MLEEVSTPNPSDSNANTPADALAPMNQSETPPYISPITTNETPLNNVEMSNNQNSTRIDLTNSFDNTEVASNTAPNQLGDLNKPITEPATGVENKIDLTNEFTAPNTLEPSAADSNPEPVKEPILINESDVQPKEIKTEDIAPKQVTAEEPAQAAESSTSEAGPIISPWTPSENYPTNASETSSNLAPEQASDNSPEAVKDVSPVDSVIGIIRAMNLSADDKQKISAELSSS